MRPTSLAILAVALLTVTLLAAEPAAAMCYIEQHQVDPVKEDTGTVVDKVVVTYGVPRCNTHPP